MKIVIHINNLTAKCGGSATATPEKSCYDLTGCCGERLKWKEPLESNSVTQSS